MSELSRFCIVGGLGFAVDAAALLVLLTAGALDPLGARVASIVLALTVTWACHRRYTFASRDPKRVAEWSRFAVVNAAGAVINFAIYSSLLLLWPAVTPLAALAAGSAVALAANYAGSRRVAFRGATTRRSRAPAPTCP